MNLRPAILSAPFPWLIMLTAKLFGKEVSKDLYKFQNTQRKKGFLNLPRTLSFTFEGKRYIAILILIGFAAINTGNNLLYLIVAMLLSIIIISGIMSESTLRQVLIKRQILGTAYKNKPFKINYLITNSKKKISSYSLNINEIPSENIEGTGTYIIKIDNLSKKSASANYTFLKRGLYKLEGVELSTRFPFGLFKKGKVNDVETEILVYPATEVINTKAKFTGSSQGQTESNKQGFGGDLFGVREHRADDDSRHIDWKSSAKSTTLMHKEFTRDSDREVIIKFFNYGSNNEVFEDKVDEASTLANHFLNRGFSVGLVTITEEITPDIGTKQAHRILKTLALIEPVSPQGSRVASVEIIEG